MPEGPGVEFIAPGEIEIRFQAGICMDDIEAASIASRFPKNRINWRYVKLGRWINFRKPLNLFRSQKHN